MSGGIDGAAVPDHPLVDAITRLFLRPGSVPQQHDNAAWHSARIRWEWQSNQWVMEVDDKGALCGWLSYYRVNGEMLDLISGLQIEAFRHGNPWKDLTRGEHLYLATAVVAPWAPPDTFQHLARCARNRNVPGAVTASWHHRYADGRSRFVQVPADSEF